MSQDITVVTYIICCTAAFFAGFIDAVAGGGGLIQLPALFIALPNTSLPSVIGTNKFPNFMGTSIAAFQYYTRFSIALRKLWLPLLIIFIGAFIGTWSLRWVEAYKFKIILLFVMLLLAIYIYLNKDFGRNLRQQRKGNMLFYFMIFVCGFYDGFIGPGTGILLIVILVYTKGLDFMHASANAKILNLSSNFASILLFATHANIIWKLTIPMSCCNVCGAYLGSRMAILRGNPFIRGVIFFVIILLLIRFSYEIFVQHG